MYSNFLTNERGKLRGGLLPVCRYNRNMYFTFMSELIQSLVPVTRENYDLITAYEENQRDIGFTY